ncbi:Ubiquinone biosynthesis protein [Mycena venus]|uniref:Ubiquinone biosynthesis protein n=1 Tax=Mycena venus TaxID=2733690 RepID=A0A8H6X975_9AGAR|nr:Ubiquinone biosynthesis protein [Mycena venus]
MAANSSTRLLKLALPLVSEHGFTRAALARSVLHLPTPHAEPLSDTAVSALFGRGDLARKTLIRAWLDDGVESMKNAPGVGTSVKDALHARLAYNEPVLAHLPEAFALLAAPESGIPPIDPVPALKHAARIADEACYVSGDQSLRLSWYTKRATLTGIYSAAELHQLTSPQTAHSFLDSLLSTSTTIDSSVEEVKLFSSYIFRSWAGIIRSQGVL